MLPRTIKVAAAVQSTFSAPQYADYGNVILNGYVTTASAVATAGAEGAINAISISAAGTNYTNGTYNDVLLAGGNGSWGYANITVAGGAVTVATLLTGGSGFVVGQVLQLGAIPRTAAGTAATLTVTSVNTRSIQPVIKGWTTNYSSYYTQIPPVSAPYDATYPGLDAGGFLYMVHSFKPPTGAITALGFGGPLGYGYTDGIYTGVATTTGRFGSGATLDIVVAGGQVQTVTLNNPGTGYQRGSTLTTTAIGPGTGFFTVITGITAASQGGEPYWSQRPVNAQAQVNSLFPLPGVGGWIYPVPDSPVPPPIDVL